jgi:hypothetical protein
MFKWARKAAVLVQSGEQADADTKKREYCVLLPSCRPNAAPAAALPHALSGPVPAACLAAAAAAATPSPLTSLPTTLPLPCAALLRADINDIKEACTMLMKTLTYWYKSFSDHSANTIAVHEDMANLYPANESYSTAVAMLNNSAKVFQEAPQAVDELKKAFESSIAELLPRLQELANKAHDRQIARSEIKYYQEKVAALANDAHSATDPKKQAKAESNNAKCVCGRGGQQRARAKWNAGGPGLHSDHTHTHTHTHTHPCRLQENKAIFQRLDEEITSGLHKLDAEIAGWTNAAMGKFMQLQAKKAHSLLDIYTQALDNIGVPPAAAATGTAALGGGGGAAEGEASGDAAQQEASE